MKNLFKKYKRIDQVSGNSISARQKNNIHTQVNKDSYNGKNC
jgi:hypothetical protein